MNKKLGQYFTKNIELQKNVSKLMATVEAVSEMKEYVLINNIDKNKDYYLGQPTQCSVSKVKSNRRAIRGCKISEKVFDDYSNYSLLIMKNGGLNLDQYAKKMRTTEAVNSENKQKVEDFWLETHRLMMGLKLLLLRTIVLFILKLFLFLISINGDCRGVELSFSGKISSKDDSRESKSSLSRFIGHIEFKSSLSKIKELTYF